MASAPLSIAMEEAMCPICLECLIDPVVLDCGHSFCQGCVTKYCEKWEALKEAPKCPTCKFKIQKGDFRRNWQLANLVEKMKLMPLSSGKEDLCLRHKENLHFFCKEDEKLVCFVCERSPEHRGHTTLVLEEAAQQYKVKIFNCLETLRTEREKILVYLADAEDESQKILKMLDSQRQMTVAEFRTLRQLLEEQEKHLLAQIEEVEKEVARKRNEHLAKLSKELSSLKSLIWETEEKHQQPASELLQDVRSSLQRCKEKENFENPVAFPSDLQWRLQGCCDIIPFLGGIMKQFKDTLVSDLQMQKANVTLNPTTTGSKLVLSEDQRSIQYERKAQDLPEDPKNIYHYSYIMGSEGFIAGCHFWEVSVGSEESWAVGVARKSVKGRIIFTPEKGIWIVGREKGKYKAFIESINPLLPLRGELKKIRVSLNYNGGQVAFFDADRGALLYRFSGASFSGDTLHPFFAVYGKGYLRVCP